MADVMLKLSWWKCPACKRTWKAALGTCVCGSKRTEWCGFVGEAR